MRKKLNAGRNFIFAAVVAVLESQTTSEAFAQIPPTQQQINALVAAEIKKAAAEINATVPIDYPQQIRLDKVTPGPGTVVTFHLTLVNSPSKDVDSGRINGIVRPGMKKVICADEKLKPVLQLGTKLQYAVQGSDGVAVGNFRFDRTDCGYPVMRL